MIETERLLIRPFQQGDYLDLFEYLSRPETYAFEPRGSNHTGPSKGTGRGALDAG